MKIQSIGVAIPSLVRSNDDIIEYIRDANEDAPKGLVDKYVRQLRALLTKAGSHTRHWRDRDAGETTYILLHHAIRSALDEGAVSTSDIDLLIYCGVGRGFIEPGNAYFCAKMMGMSCQCFDISDACMSYVRALDIAQSYLSSGRYRNVLIVNAECAVYEYGYPQTFKIDSLRQLNYTFPAYTIGEGVTATLLTADGEDWEFAYESDPSLAHLCTIPAQGFREFFADPADTGHHDVGRFTSYGAELFQIGVQRMAALCRKQIRDLSEPDIWFPHAAAATPCFMVADLLGLSREAVYVDSFTTYGNLASASIPTAMWSAMTESKLHRGMKVVLAPASAGMSFAAVTFTL